MRARSAFVYVQHLLGIGHFVRAREVAAALGGAGFDVVLASGGMPVASAPRAGVRVVQLPPIRVADASFTPLRDAAFEPIDEAFRQRRREALLAAYEACDPAVVVVETFPFGRRALGFEIVPLLERAHASQRRPCVVASVRDILQRPRKPGRDDESLDAARRWFDAILVHGDPRFVRLEATFPRAAELAPAVRYTGFVLAPRAAVDATDRDEVVVSAGGGAVGAALLETALAARSRSCLRDLRWRVLAGANLGDDALHRLQSLAAPGIVIERSRDLPGALARAHVSISQAGYNTVLDVAASGARAVLVPFAADGETEQAMRAQRMAAHELAVVVDERELSPGSLAAAVDHAALRPRWRRFDFDCDGARNSALAIAQLIDAGSCSTAATLS